MKQHFDNARLWMYRNARPLDIARWQYHFESGTAENVLHCLSVYQNADGGFAHALEADSWNPNSSPIQTWCATEILHEIGHTDAAHPIVQGILRYLDSGQDFATDRWPSSVMTNNDYPHADWWSCSADTTFDYNPTAALAGFAVRFAAKDSALYEKACAITKQAAEWFFAQDAVQDGHLLSCFARLWECCVADGRKIAFDKTAHAVRLYADINKCVAHAETSWLVDGVVYGLLQIYHALSSTCDPQISAILPCDQRAETFARHLLETQQADGAWDVPWGWSKYAEEWAISKNWWKAHGIIANMLFLKQQGVL